MAGKPQISDLGNLSAKIDAIHEALFRRQSPLLTVGKFAELVGRSAYTVRRWISQGRIRATRIGGTGPRGRLLIPRTELDRVIASGLGESVRDAAVLDASSDASWERTNV